mgnify:FL=1
MMKKFIAILAAGWLLGLISLTLVYLLPTERMEQNVRSSMEVFYTESVYPQQVPGYKATQLDNETDAIMLLGAIYDGGGYSAIKQAMRAARVDISDIPSKCNVLIKYAWENQTPDSVSEYTRYWHGYMLWLKPLLLLFDYADIRMLNMMVQTLLLFWLIRELTEKKQQKLVVPLAFAVMVINPVAAAMSMQFSSIYDIVLLSMILILRYHEKWETEGKYPYFFLILGMTTVFFDFLTYPMAALGIPLILVLIMKKQGLKQGIYDAVGYSLCFAAGYAGMWAGKWIMASLILGENVLAEAMGQAGVHSGAAVVDGQELSHLGVIWRNVRVLIKWPYVLAMAGMFFVYIFRIFKNKAAAFRKETVIPIGLVCLIPFGWIWITSSHAAWCYWYTYRGISVAVFGVFSILSIISGRKEYVK